jgi:hypothetical protein
MIDCVARSVDPARANERESFMHNCAIITTIIIKLLRPRNMIVKWREKERKRAPGMWVLGMAANAAAANFYFSRWSTQLRHRASAQLAIAACY